MGAKVGVLEKDGRYNVYLFYDIVYTEDGSLDKNANKELENKLTEFGEFINIAENFTHAYPFVPKMGRGGKHILKEFADCKLPKETKKEYIGEIKNKCESLGIEFKEGMPFWRSE